MALIQAFAADPGYLGGDVRDPQWAHGEWQIVHRWADAGVAGDWALSDTRERWKMAVVTLTAVSPRCWSST